MNSSLGFCFTSVCCLEARTRGSDKKRAKSKHTCIFSVCNSFKCKMVLHYCFLDSLSKSLKITKDFPYSQKRITKHLVLFYQSNIRPKMSYTWGYVWQKRWRGERCFNHLRWSQKMWWTSFSPSDYTTDINFFFIMYA